MARNPIRIFIVALSTLVLGACSKDSGTNSQPATPTPIPTTLAIVSGDNQTGTVNQVLGAAVDGH